MPSDTMVDPIPQSNSLCDNARLSAARGILGEPQEPPKGRLRGFLDGLSRRDRKRIAMLGAGLTGLILILWIGPVLILLMLAVVFWLPLALFALVGPDKTWRHLVRRHPRLAEGLRRRADKLAVHYDALLDRLPEDWVEGLYLPDMSQPIRPVQSPADSTRGRTEAV